MGVLFPDVNNCQDLLEMRGKQQLDGHPKKIFTVLKEALKAINDADVFYAKMEGVGKLMAKVGLDLENLKVSCIFYEILQYIIKTLFSREICLVWQNHVCFVNNMSFRSLANVVPTVQPK